jgi:hypothetical protein
MKYIFQEQLNKLKSGDEILIRNNSRKNKVVEYINSDGKTPTIKLHDENYHWNFFFKAHVIIEIIQKEKWQSKVKNK